MAIYAPIVRPIGLHMCKGITKCMKNTLILWIPKDISFHRGIVMVIPEPNQYFFDLLAQLLLQRQNFFRILFTGEQMMGLLIA
ncbi:hypothetical protein D3C71_1446860 [compost metagenome]